MLRKKQKLFGHEGMCWCVSWSPSGNALASCGQDKTIRIWDAFEDSFKCVGVANEDGEIHSRTVRRITWRGDSNYIGCASFDSTSSIWSIRPDGKLHRLAKISGQENEVKGICFSPCGDMIATCSRDKSVWVFDINALLAKESSSGSYSVESDFHRVSAHESEFDFPSSPSDKQRSLFGDSDDVECLAVLLGHSQDVKAVKFNPFDSHMLVSVSYDDSVKIWRSTTNDDWQLQETLKGHRNTVWDVVFNPENPGEFATVSADGCMKIWTSGGVKTSIKPGHSYLLTGPLGVSSRRHNHDLLPLTASGWSCQTIQIASALMEQTNPAPVYSIDWSTNGLIAVACGDNSVGLYVRRGSSVIPISTMKTDSEPNCVAFRPRVGETDCSQLAVALDDGSIAVYEICDWDVLNYS